MIHHLVESYKYILAVLLVQVSIVAMVASLLLHFRRFTHLIVDPDSTRRQRLEFGVVLGLIGAMLSWARLELGYTGADVTVIFPLLSGFIMGPGAGVLTGAVGGLYALRDGELLTMPMGAAIGFGAGYARTLLGRPEDVWEYTALPYGNTWRIWRRWRDDGEIDSLVVILLTGAGAEVFRTEVSRLVGTEMLFSFLPRDPVSYYAVVLACLVATAVALKIWNTPRLEAELRRREALLAEARLESLRRQIQPHFLFNTLNTISVLVRTRPEEARTIIVKLSAILRRLLYFRENTNPLRAELELVENYLDIELVRFGQDRLDVREDISPQALQVDVPSMILQPLVENALKHGLSSHRRGGVVTIRAYIEQGQLHLSVSDNGKGMSPDLADASLRRGIGLTNIRERLKSIYGDAQEFHLESVQGKGTTVRMILPVRSAAP